MPTANTTTTNHACAACKFQRRRCAPNCPLAPYFPPDNPTQFLNAHKLFGVHNILKTLLSVGPGQRPDAMKALIFTANARARDPVGGCYRMIQQLRAEIAQTQAQLDVVLSCIAVARAQLGLGGFGGDVDEVEVNSSNSGLGCVGEHEDVKPSNLGRRL